MSNQNRDWGCLHWFILAFLMWVMIVVLSVMATRP